MPDDVIKLLVNDGGRAVWKTFQGRWLVSGSETMGTPGILPGKGMFLWKVAESKGNKLAVWRAKDPDEPGEITIYDSWSAMRPDVPEHIFTYAQRTGGILERPQYPEEPLKI